MLQGGWFELMPRSDYTIFKVVGSLLSSHYTAFCLVIRSRCAFILQDWHGGVAPYTSFHPEKPWTRMSGLKKTKTSAALCLVWHPLAADLQITVPIFANLSKHMQNHLPICTYGLTYSYTTLHTYTIKVSTILAPYISIQMSQNNPPAVLSPVLLSDLLKLLPLHLAI